MISRPSWNQWYLGIAQKIAERSVCLHRRVGAILVRERQIISAGYNGPLSGHDHCSILGGCAREGIPSGQRMELCRGTHAEQNAIDYAARFGNVVKGASLYTTHFPCSWCTKSIVQTGIVEVVYNIDYPDSLAKRLLQDSGIAVRKVKAEMECGFCHKITEQFLIIPYGSLFDNLVICMKCLDGALTWLEHSTKMAEYLQDAVDSV